MKRARFLFSENTPITRKLTSEEMLTLGNRGVDMFLLLREHCPPIQNTTMRYDEVNSKIVVINQSGHLVCWWSGVAKAWVVYPEGPARVDRDGYHDDPGAAFVLANGLGEVHEHFRAIAQRGGRLGEFGQ